MHVFCKTPGASNRIDGKLFVPVDHGGKMFHVSEDMPEDAGKRLLTIPGFELFRGDSVKVKEAITRFKQEQVHIAESGDQRKDREIKELQGSCTALGEQLGKANVLITELREENIQLKAQIGEPSELWSRKRLAEHAEGMGLIINTGNSKEEILEMIDLRITQRG